jgi:hypothetical protein
LSIEKEFKLLGIMEEETVDEYFARILSIINNSKMHGNNVEQIIVLDERSLDSG